MNLLKRTAIVTGSSRGLGKAIALSLAKNGADVVVNYLNNKDLADQVVKSIKAMGRKSISIKADVTSFSHVDNMVQRTLHELGKIDILVNNAGLYKDNVVWKMPDAVWDDVISVNLKGTFNCTKVAIREMRKYGYGRVINISSVVGQVGIFGTSNYSAAKSGIFGFTKAVAKEVARKNITVNALTLGYFETGMLKRLSSEVQANILKQIPMNRFGQPSEVGEMVSFLASEKSGYLTGQIIHLNGGYYM
jgi:3-oxoacyl-[acyl-carrier protein] reductase